MSSQSRARGRTTFECTKLKGGQHLSAKKLKFYMLYIHTRYNNVISIFYFLVKVGTKFQCIGIRGALFECTYLRRWRGAIGGKKMVVGLNFKGNILLLLKVFLSWLGSVH